jgi:hypothetical protein
MQIELQYVEFLKLREKYKQQVLELNSLRTEKTTMLIKNNDLEERLLETHLQLERVFDEKLTHMLSIQKCPTNKIGVGYVPSSTCETLSTSKTIFVKPVIPESPPSCVDKGKLLWNEKFQLSLNLWSSFLSEESFPHAITVVSSDTSYLSAHIRKLKGRHTGRLLKLPCVTNVELAVMSGPRVLHLKRSRPGIMDLFPEIPFQGINSSRSLLQQRRLESPKSLM